MRGEDADAYGYVLVRVGLFGLRDDVVNLEREVWCAFAYAV
jgi:hypothetical protein